MFSDIKGFTTISEMLSQTDLLTLLYMYLSEMTQIVEKYGGVVSEPLQNRGRKNIGNHVSRNAQCTHIIILSFSLFISYECR